MAAASAVCVQLEGEPFALIMLLLSGASGLSEGARFKDGVWSNMDRILRELQFIHPTLLPPSLKQASGGMKNPSNWDVAQMTDTPTVYGGKTD